MNRHVTVLWLWMAALAAFIAPAQADRVFTGNMRWAIDPATESQISEMKEQVAYIMSLDTQAVRDLVPRQSAGLWFTDCPNCNHGRQDRGRFEWSPRQPDRITCQGCGASYPDHPDYPYDGYVDVRAPGGRTHRFHYHERKRDGHRLYFGAKLDWLAKAYLEQQARSLGELYYATKDQAYAQRAADILIRFAEVYPGYPLTYDYPRQPKEFAAYDDLEFRARFYPYRIGKWSWWAIMDISIPLIQAYDAIRDWDGLDQLSGGDARRMIEQDLLGAMVQYHLDTPDWQRSTHQPRVHKLLAARVLERPEWVHEAIRRFSRIQQEFLYDGLRLNHSPSYIQQFMGTLTGWARASQGYSDPPGYLDPVDNVRFDQFDLNEHYPFYPRLKWAMDAIRLPNGRMLPVNDTWATHNLTFSYAQPRASTESVLLPGMGIALLGGGEGEHQFHSYLNFTDGTYHTQRDALSIGLFANGHELLPDIGYSHSRYRFVWTSGTASHNTVLVDGTDSSRGNATFTDRQLLEYVDRRPHFQLASARSTQSYAQTDTFRRTLIKIGHDSRDAYLLDLFHVSGGQQHDYLLHGSADVPSFMQMQSAGMIPSSQSLINAAMAEPFAQVMKQVDVRWEDTTNQMSLGMIQVQQQSAQPQQTVCLDMRLSEQPQIGYRTWLTTPPASPPASPSVSPSSLPSNFASTASQADFTVYLGQSPSVRPAGENNAQLDDHHMPTFVARRVGQNDQTITHFVAAHEPVNGQPRLESLAAHRHGDCTMAQITHQAGTDYVIIADHPLHEAATFQTSHGQLRTDASYAVVRLSSHGELLAVEAVGASVLAFGDLALHATPGWSGQLIGYHRPTGQQAGYFDVQADITAAPAATFFIHFPDGTPRGFNITGFEPLDQGTRIHVREDPGFEIKQDGIHLVTPTILSSGEYRMIEGQHIDWSLANTLSYPAP